MYTQQESASNLELQMTRGNTFSPEEEANFRAAFKVFDVHDKERISVTEIFEVLKTMGNEVSEERRMKIHKAVEDVTRDSPSSGDEATLNFEQFIAFMQIMKMHNEEEANLDDDDVVPVGEDAFISIEDKRYCCCMLTMRAHEDSPVAQCKTLCESLVGFVLVFNILHAILVLASFWLDDDFVMNNIVDGDEDDQFEDVLKYLVYFNSVNLLLFILALVKMMPCCVVDEDEFYYHYIMGPLGFVQSAWNGIKWSARPLMVTNGVYCLVHIIGNGQFAFEMDFFVKKANQLGMCYFSVVSTYFAMSYLWWLDTSAAPSSHAANFVVFITDLLFYNWMRVILTLICGLLVIITLPVQMVFWVLRIFAPCCCADTFDFHEPASWSSRILLWPEKITPDIISWNGQRLF